MYIHAYCTLQEIPEIIKVFFIYLQGFFLYIMLQKYLQAQVCGRRVQHETFSSVLSVTLQSVVWPFILSGLLTNIISAILHALLIFVAGLGVA